MIVEFWRHSLWGVQALLAQAPVYIRQELLKRHRDSSTWVRRAETNAVELAWENERESVAIPRQHSDF
jgi:hypothetical protein